MSSDQQQSATSESFRMIMSLVFNVVSSVGVIFINKRLVFNAAGFHFPTALTIIHFVICFLGCVAFAKSGFFEWKSMQLSKVLGISLAFCGYVAFNNLSLLTNSVSVYQISKILVTPVLIILEYVTQGKTQTRETLLSLVPVCIGIIVTVYTDAEVNLVGTFWAGLAIIANAFYTMWGSTKQKELDVTPMQILSYQAPMSALILCFTLPVFEPWHELAHFRFTGSAVAFICLSCAFAFGVNFSFFLSVGKTSPLTINVLGYLKTCLVFVGGFIFFDTVPTWKNVFGITLTMLGFAMYTRSKMPSSSNTTSSANNNNSSSGVGHKPSSSGQQENPSSSGSSSTPVITTIPNSNNNINKNTSSSNNNSHQYHVRGVGSGGGSSSNNTRQGLSSRFGTTTTDSTLTNRLHSHYTQQNQTSGGNSSNNVPSLPRSYSNTRLPDQQQGYNNYYQQQDRTTKV